MNKSSLSRFFSLGANSIFYRLKLSFAFFFLTPLIVFFLLGLQYNIIESQESYYYILAILVFSLFGYVIVRQIVQGVDRVAKTMEQQMTERLGIPIASGDEIERIETTFKTVSTRLEQSNQSLQRRMTEIEALRELNQTSFSHFDRQSLLNRALERALEVTQSAGGALFELERRGPNAFLVCRSVCGEHIVIAENDAVPLAKLPVRQALEKATVTLMPRSESNGWQGVLSDSDPECQIAVVPVTEEMGFSGVAVLIKTGPDRWAEDNLNFLTSLFGVMARSLKIQALGRQEQETAEDLKTVLYILQMINSGLTEKEMLLAIAKKLREVIPHHWAGLALVEEGIGGLKLAYSIPKPSASLPLGSVLPEQNSLLCTALRARSVLNVEDLSEQPDYVERVLWEELELKSCLMAGLHFKGQSIGVVCLSHVEKNAFRIAHERIFSMITEGLSLALNQSRLLQQAREKTGELEVLNRIGRALTSSTFNMERVLTYTLEIISGLINVEAGSLLLLEGDELVFKVAIGKAGESLKGLRIKLGQGVVGWVAATGESMVVRDASENPHFYHGVDERTGFKTRNLLCIPMIVGGRTIGTIELINKVKGTFSDEDLRVLKSVATSAAIAIENSQLYSSSINMAKRERLIRTIFQKYVPEEVASEILGREEGDLITLGNRRLVTLLNVDIRGYSLMSKQASAETVVSILNYFFMRMGTIVLKHKGILDKYLGDGLLAIFGAPVATRNPALDATLAAIEMVEAMELVDKFAQEKCGIPLHMGVSINTGEAIVGNVGFEKKMDFTAIGEVVNDTFRLQKLTREKPNSILVSQSTFEKIEPFVQARSAGVKVLGANEGQMAVYEITGKKEMSDTEYLLYQAKITEKQQLAKGAGDGLHPPGLVQ